MAENTSSSNNTQSQTPSTVTSSNEPGFFDKSMTYLKENWKPICGGMAVGAALGAGITYAILSSDD